MELLLQPPYVFHRASCFCILQSSRRTRVDLAALCQERCRQNRIQHLCHQPRLMQLFLLCIRQGIEVDLFCSGLLQISAHPPLLLPASPLDIPHFIQCLIECPAEIHKKIRILHRERGDPFHEVGHHSKLFHRLFQFCFDLSGICQFFLCLCLH